MHVHDDANFDADMPLEPAVLDELRELVARLCDEQLDECDRPRLNAILDSQAAARQYYLKYMGVHSSLAAMAGSASADDAQLAVERMTLARFAGRTDPILSACDIEPLRSQHAARWQSVLRWAAGVSAVVAVATLSWWFTAAEPTSDVAPQLVLASGHARTEAAPGTAQPLAAEVTYVSSVAMWQNPNASFALASRVRVGENLVLERGQVELTYASGTKLLLTGPSEFLVRPTGGTLVRGELVARVPQAGHGFTIETPHGKVVDLGTEFGVVVDDFGVSQVSVFEGKVETLPTGPAGQAQDKIELTTGRAIQWTENSITPISVQGRGYSRPDDGAAASEGSAAEPLIDVDFRLVEPDHAVWRTRGGVVSSGHGLLLQGSAASRPYLIAADELDPVVGPVTTVCDLLFENVADAENASFAILTRSADAASKPGTPWQDMLARSVRCRLTTDLLSGEGLLEAGTKYEADREHTNISWGGFSQPQPGTRYRLEMRDDGLNVSFTVSLVDNPAVRKTITCRSLFRGNQNFVAIEGPSRGTATIERLVISQEARSRDDGGSLAFAALDERSANRVASTGVTRQLDDLAPVGGKLLLLDTFDSSEIDASKWNVLDEVKLIGGEVQLGTPNKEQHIDTWKARPYLVTRRQFDPDDGPLTILGKVTFSENFLHGYGGSFAVMTRADDEHGGGPGWENSILRRGVRSNFWPAAYGFDHSLEIHEKPDRNTISLLVAEGFPIAPNSRSYLFRVIDDGTAAQISLVDARDPATRKTVSHPTSSAMQRGGYVGFESCWGSPLRLDDVRIYRGGSIGD